MDQNPPPLLYHGAGMNLHVRLGLIINNLITGIYCIDKFVR